MKSIQKFLQKYLNIKIKNNIINFVVQFSVFFIIYIALLIFIEKNAFLDPNIKTKIFSITYAIIIFNLIYISLKVIIHKNNFFNNSNNQQLAKELINRLPIKDRLINALQIYSKVDFKNPYSDLTVRAVNDLEQELSFLDFKKIKLEISYKLLYLLLAGILFFFLSMKLSNNYYDAGLRLISKNIKFEKPLPFLLSLNYENKFIFKGEKYTINILGTGKELPEKIQLFWSENNNLYNRELSRIDNMYSYTFKNINSEIKLWAEYKNEAILPYNKYLISSDTINVNLKIRPKIKNLEITVIPPEYTKIEPLLHRNTSLKINVLKGSKIKLKGISNKPIQSSNIIFGVDSLANMNVENNIINYEFEVFDSKNISIICYDQDNNSSLKIKYAIDVINDMNPTANIMKPENNIKIDEKYLIPLVGELSDDFGINKALLEYYIVTPYYLEQDTTISNNLILESNNNTKEYFQYDWDISNMNIGPGDEIIYWVKVYDNNIKTGPGIGKSNIQRAYFPSLEELFLEVENEQEDIFETFDNMNESMEELKDMYEDISNDVLKEELGWEQEKYSEEMMNEMETISDKINNLEEAIQKIEELNKNNNLINENLSDKIEALQKMFQDIITPELMEALQELQKSLNEDDMQKSLDNLNNLEFEMEDLENELDRMIDLFKQVVAEQKLDELIKKIDNMKNLQKEISNEINHNKMDSNINSMEEKQKNNLSDMLDTMESAEELFQNTNKKTADSINQLRNSSISNNLQKEVNNISNNNDEEKKKTSSEIESHINDMKNKLNEIISEYNKKLSIEILTMYTRIIKNLLDMSYEQELINKESKNIKYKTNSNIKNIASKENIILYQYKNLFIQISDLSSKSFHIKPEVSKSFGQIFNNLIKTINHFEQGEINLAKKHQSLILEYINKAALLLLNAMDEMQASNSASGYEEYLQSMQELTQGQQLMNQGMQSLLPIPFGQQPGQNSLMQSLMKQQKQLMEQLKQLMEDSDNPGGGGKDQQGELGKALEEMEDIINNLQNNIMNQETFDKGEKVYNKLLNHQKATKEKGKEKLWETEKFNNNDLMKNNKTKNLNDKNTLEVQELYETLNRLNENKNITKENKNIIEEYIKILIDEKIEQKNNEE